MSAHYVNYYVNAFAIDDQIVNYSADGERKNTCTKVIYFYEFQVASMFLNRGHVNYKANIRQ